MMLQEGGSYLESGFVIKNRAWPALAHLCLSFLAFASPGMMQKEGLARCGL